MEFTDLARIQGVFDSKHHPRLGPIEPTASLKMILSMAKQPSAKDRRYSRIGIPRGLFVAWNAHGERKVSRVGTLGLGGLFIRTGEPQPIGERLQLVFEVPGGVVRAACIVRDSEDGRGMGVEFTSMNADARARLSHLLRRLLRD